MYLYITLLFTLFNYLMSFVVTEVGIMIKRVQKFSNGIVNEMVLALKVKDKDSKCITNEMCYSETYNLSNGQWLSSSHGVHCIEYIHDALSLHLFKDYLQCTECGTSTNTCTIRYTVKCSTIIHLILDCV